MIGKGKHTRLYFPSVGDKEKSWITLTEAEAERRRHAAEHRDAAAVGAK